MTLKLRGSKFATVAFVERNQVNFKLESWYKYTDEVIYEVVR